MVARSEALHHRLATPDDMAALEVPIGAVIGERQGCSSMPRDHALDSQLVRDGTCFVLLDQGGEIVGGGGWSRRDALCGGDESPGRDPRRCSIRPAHDAARVRAMYTDPRHVRRGIGRLIIALCEAAAQAEGFSRAELASTLAAEPLYRACGHEPIEEPTDASGGADVPLLCMRKTL